MKFSEILATVRQRGIFDQFYRSSTPNAFLRARNITGISKESDLDDCQFPSLIRAFFAELKYDYDALKARIQQTEYGTRTAIQNAIAASENIPYIPKENEDELKKELADGIKLKAIFKAPTLNDYKPAIFRGSTANEMHEDWSRKDDYKFIIGNTTRSNLPLFAHDHSLVNCFKKGIDQDEYLMTFALLSKLGYYTNYMPNKIYFGDLMDRYVEILKEIFSVMSACMITGSNGVIEPKYPHKKLEFYEFCENEAFERIYEAIKISIKDSAHNNNNNAASTSNDEELSKKIDSYPGLKEYLNNKERGDSEPLFTSDQINSFLTNDRKDLKEKYLRTIKNMKAFNLQYSDSDEFSYERMEMSVRYKWVLVSYVFEYGKGPEYNSNAEFSTFYKGLMTEKFLYNKVGGYCHEYSTIDFSKENHRKLLELSHEGIPSTFRTSMLKRATGGVKLSFIRFIISICTDPILKWFGQTTKAFLNLILICQQEGVPINTYIMNPQWGHEKDSCELLDQKLSIFLRIILCNGDVNKMEDNYEKMKNMFYSKTVNNLNAINSVVADKDKDPLLLPNGNKFAYKDEIITLNEFTYFFQTIVCDQHHFPMKVYNHTIGKLFEDSKGKLNSGLGLNPKGWDNNDIQFDREYSKTEIDNWNENHSIDSISDISKTSKKDLVELINKMADRIIKFDEIMNIINTSLSKNKKNLVERQMYLDGPGYSKNTRPVTEPKVEPEADSEQPTTDDETDKSEGYRSSSDEKSDAEDYFDWESS